MVIYNAWFRSLFGRRTRSASLSDQSDAFKLPLSRLLKLSGLILDSSAHLEVLCEIYRNRIVARGVARIIRSSEKPKVISHRSDSGDSNFAKKQRTFEGMFGRAGTKHREVLVGLWCVAVKSVRLHAFQERDPLFGSFLLSFFLFGFLGATRSFRHRQVPGIHSDNLYLWMGIGLHGIRREAVHLLRKWNHQRSLASPLHLVASRCNPPTHSSDTQTFVFESLSGTSLSYSPAEADDVSLLFTHCQQKTATKWQRYMTHQKQPQNSLSFSNSIHRDI